MVNQTDHGHLFFTHVIIYSINFTTGLVYIAKVYITFSQFSVYRAYLLDINLA